MNLRETELFNSFHQVIDLLEIANESIGRDERALFVYDAHDVEEVCVAGSTLALALFATQIDSDGRRSGQTLLYYLAKLLEYQFTAI